MEVVSQRILLVGGDEDLEYSLSSLIHTVGYQLRRAVNKKEALDCVRAEVFHLIFLDLQADTREVEIIPEIKNLCPGADVLVLSEDPTSETVAHAFQNGASGYLKKPLEPSEVINYLKRKHRGDFDNGS